MKTKLKMFYLFLLILICAFPTTALAASPAQNAAVGFPDQFVIGNNYTLNSGQTLEGNLWVIGGNAKLEQGSTVTGNVQLMGGNLVANGEIGGNISATGGLVDLGDQAVVHGDVNIFGATLNRASGARIEGQIRNEPRGPFRFTGPSQVQVPGVDVRVDPFWGFLSLLFRSFLTAALAVLVVIFVPRHTERVTHTILTQPVISGGLGLLTIVIAPVVLLVLTITIILIPVSLLALLALAILIVFGWIALGSEIGRRLAIGFKQEWAPPVTAGIGTFLMTFVADGISRYVACVGWLVPALIALVGLGAVLLTRLGTQTYPTVMPLPPSPGGPIYPVTPTDLTALEAPNVNPPDTGAPEVGGPVPPTPPEEPGSEQ